MKKSSRFGNLKNDFDCKTRDKKTCKQQQQHNNNNISEILKSQEERRDTPRRDLLGIDGRVGFPAAINWILSIKSCRGRRGWRASRGRRSSRRWLVVAGQRENSNTGRALFNDSIRSSEVILGRLSDKMTLALAMTLHWQWGDHGIAQYYNSGVGFQKYPQLGKFCPSRGCTLKCHRMQTEYERGR